jgi:hypothetical protein
MRSNGTSKIIGPAIAARAALARLVPESSGLRTRMTTKTTAAAVKVTGAMSSGGAALLSVR